MSAVLRNAHTGTAWFSDIELREVLQPITMFDGAPTMANSKSYTIDAPRSQFTRKDVMETKVMDTTKPDDSSGMLGDCVMLPRSVSGWRGTGASSDAGMLVIVLQSLCHGNIFTLELE